MPMTPPPAETTVPGLFLRGRRLATGHLVSVAVAALALLSLIGVWTATSSARSRFRDPVMPATSVAQQSAESAPPAPAAPPVPNTAVSPSPRTTPSSAPIAPQSSAAAPVAVAGAASLEVAHLHRFGSCRGRLSLTRDGIAFAAEEQNDADAFTLKFAEFVHALSDDTLTLKSATKTYRFKALESHGGSASRLRELADRISRARR